MSIGSLLAAAGTGIGITSGALSLVDPLKRGLLYFMNTIIPNNRLSPDTYLSLMLRDKIYTKEGRRFLRDLGFDDHHVDMMIAASEQLLSAIDNITLFRREKISSDELLIRCARLNVPEHTLDELEHLTQFYPTVPDFIRFAVREVYDKQAIDDGKLLQDFPEQFWDESRKLGLTREHANAYWISHWSLPSVQMGYEMLHRNIIEPDRLKLLMRQLDIAPGWREDLIRLSYNPITRVDIRRMWRVGSITDYKELIRRYMDYGSNQKDAELLADYTVRTENAEMEGITRANVGDAYMDALITEQQLADYLAKLNPASTYVNFWMDHYIYERIKKEVADRKAQLQEMYLSGSIDIGDIRQMLLDEGQPSGYVEYVIREFQQLTWKRETLPGIETIIRWYEDGIIPDIAFSKYLKRLGYNEETQRNYITEIIVNGRRKPRKWLTIAQYTGFVKQGIFSRDMFVATLTEMGIDIVDINAILLGLEGENE